MRVSSPETAPDGFVRFKDILAFYESRLQLSRTVRQRMVRVPFDLDYPYWIEDPDFDLEYHVRHIALPEPGDCWRVALDHWAGVIEADEQHPQPIVRAAIRRLRRAPPPPATAVRVVHGDYRTGNFLHDGQGQILAILDWEIDVLKAIGVEIVCNVVIGRTVPMNTAA